MKKLFLIWILIFQSILVIGQLKNDNKGAVGQAIIYISNLNTDSKSLSLSKPSDKNANIYFGLANKNSIDFCAVNDSCMLIHNIENNSFILIGANNQVLDQFNYFKKIRGLKKVLSGSPFCGANGNISFINDSTVFVSTIKKGSNFCLLYLNIKNNKIIPIIERLDKYPEFFDEKMTESPVWKIFSAFKSKDTFIVTYYKEQSHSDSLRGDTNFIYNVKCTDVIVGKNYLTNDTMYIVKNNNTVASIYSVYDFNNTFLITEEHTGYIYQYGANLKFIDSVNVKPHLNGRHQIINILKDAITKNTYVILPTYNRQKKTFCFDIYQIINNLNLKFYKHLSFERETYIKTINNNKIFFPYVNNDDFKYYIYNIDLSASKMDSLFVRYSGKMPPKLKVNIYDSQSNLIRMQKDKTDNITKDNFVKLKKRDRKLFPEIEKNVLKYPQSTVKEVIQSVIKATDSSDFFYEELYLLIWEKDEYENAYENNREALKNEIENKTWLLEEHNYKFNEVKRLLIYLLENIDNAYIEEKEGVTTIEITEEDTDYKFIFVKEGNEYFMDKLVHGKKKKEH
ncbi:MAG: hypothetical protein HXX18_04945 [Bacteroidetes bacterium]|nr:hypothetical protein [Bacteroidota bacterium]